MNNTETAGLLKIAAVQLRAVTTDRDRLDGELTALKKQARAEKLAEAMVERGMMGSEDLQEKIAELVERDDLDVVAEALNLSAPENLAKLASVGEEAQAGGGEGGMSQLEAFVLSGHDARG